MCGITHLVRCQSVNGLGGITPVPKEDLVVVAAGGQELALVRRPLHPADFLRVARQRADVVVGHPDVVQVDVAAPAAAGQDVGVPVQRGDTPTMARHSPHALPVDVVPQLDVAVGVADCDDAALLDPGEGAGGKCQIKKTFSNHF